MTGPNADTPPPPMGRREALAAGLKVYACWAYCGACGTNLRTTLRAQCVACLQREKDARKARDEAIRTKARAALLRSLRPVVLRELKAEEREQQRQAEEARKAKARAEREAATQARRKERTRQRAAETRARNKAAREATAAESPEATTAGAEVARLLAPVELQELADSEQGWHEPPGWA